MNKDTRMKHLGYITTAFNRFRATVGRSEYSYRELRTKEELYALRDVVAAAIKDFEVDDDL